MNDELYIKVETIQNILISRATGGKENNVDYVNLRKELTENILIEKYVPKFLKTCRSLDQFWQFIKNKYSSYDERRKYIYDEFQLLLGYLEQKKYLPSDRIITEGLNKIDTTYIQASWKKSLERRVDDPEGAITSARTLIETVCKHILDDMKIEYDDTIDLPKLYRETAKVLNLAPSQHTEEVFKQILGGCTAIIEGLGSLRNRLSDAHGRGANGVKPSSRHAELAVNLSGSLGSYLLATWEKIKK